MFETSWKWQKAFPIPAVWSRNPWLAPGSGYKDNFGIQIVHWIWSNIKKTQAAGEYPYPLICVVRVGKDKGQLRCHTSAAKR